MKRILIAALFFAIPAFAADLKTQDAIEAMLGKFDACVSKSDTKCLSEFFADDATFSATFDGGKLIKGKAALMKTLEGMNSAPGMKGVEQKRTVEYVRFIGDDRAFVDCLVELTGSKAATEEKAENWPKWHSTALMAVKGGKWVIEDARIYFIAPPPAPMPTQGPAPTLPPKSDEPAKPEGTPES